MPANLMKLPFWLLVASFVPLPLFAESVFFRQSPPSGSPPFAGSSFEDQATYGAEYVPYYRTHSMDSEPAEGAYLSGSVGGAGWNYGDYGTNAFGAPQPRSYAQHVPDTRYLSNSPSYGDGRYHPADVSRPGWTSNRGRGYSDRWASINDSADAAGGGYGFRGERPRGIEDWNATPWQDGYRFRPLTDQEQRRMSTATGWRPRSPYPLVERRRTVDEAPTAETYGYQPDGWLGRYYGGP